MSDKPPLIRAVLQRISVRTALYLFLGTAALLLLAFFWIHIPDSHIWQLAFSFVLAAAMLAGLLWLYTEVIRNIRRAAVPCSRWLAAIVLLGWAAIKWLLLFLASLIDTDAASQRAGYWNSQLSAGMRHIFTYERLVAWQHDTVVLLVWFAIPALLLPFVVETVAAGRRRNTWFSALRTLRGWQHWLGIAVIMLVIYQLSKHLLAWRPLHSVSGEIVSIVLRLLFVYTADVLLVLLLIAFDSELLAREHAARDTAS